MAETFGRALRRWREAAELSQAQLARLVPISQSSLSRYEADRQTVDQATADRLDELTGAGGELCALADPAGVVLTPDDRDRLAYVAERPRSVDPAAVDSLAVVLAEQRRLEDVLGSGAMILPTRSYTGLVEGLVLNARGPVRPRIVDVAAQWAQFAGWLHIATGQLPTAGKWLDRATEWALETGNADMVATALSLKGYGAWKLDQLGPMVGLSAAAQRDRVVSPGLRAIAAQQEARAHALLGEADATDRKLDEALALADEIDPDREPPWVYFYGPDYLHMQRGRAYRYLGRHQEAAELLTAGLDALPPDLRGAEWALNYQRDLEAVHAL